MNGIDNTEYLEKLKQFRPMDDTFMRSLFRKSPAATTRTLQIIMSDDSLKIDNYKTQADLNRLVGARSICLDVDATDAAGRKYDMEVQKGSKGASIKRLRYHGSALDIENLDASQDFDELPEVRVIFITEEDTFGDGLPIHELILQDTATGKLHDDGKHLIYVNGEYRGDDNLGRLMHDFNCKNADDMLIPEMAEATRYLKETKGGQKYMCEVMQGLVDEKVEEKQKSIALTMLKGGQLTTTAIAEYADLPIEEVEQLKKQIEEPKRA